MFAVTKEQKTEKYAKKLFEFMNANSWEFERAKMHKLVEKLGDPNYLYDGKPLLHYALEAFWNPADKALVLVMAGVDINQKDQSGNTALLHIAKRGRWEGAHVLLERGNLDIGILDSDGRGLFPHALRDQQWSFCERLFDMGQGRPEIAARNHDILEFMYSGAAPSGLIEKVMALPEVDVNGRVHTPPVHYVAANNNRNDFPLLLKRKDFNINTLDSSKQTALQYVLERHIYSHVEFLLDNGIDVRNQNAKGFIALETAAGLNEIWLVRKIIEKMAPMTEADQMFLDRCLITAVTNDQLRIAEILIEAGADVNARGRGGKTGLIIAVERRSQMMIDGLLKQGADQNIADDQGLSARDHAGRDYTKAMLPVLDNAASGAYSARAVVGDGGKYVRHGDHTIEVCESTSLSTTFNFSTKQVLYRQGEAMTAQNFEQVQGQDAIEAAYTKLIEMGGQAEKPQLYTRMIKKSIDRGAK